MKKTNKLHFSVIILPVLLLLLFFPQNIGRLTVEMVQILLVIICVLILWIQKPIPIAISSLAILAILPIIGLVDNMNAAFSGFTNATNFFVVASFGLSLAVKKTSISNRILKKFLLWSDGKASRIILSYMFVVYLLSCFMSDIPAVMIGIAFAEKMLDSLSGELQRKTGKTLMLALPFASIIGGMTTPAGSSINLLALNLLESSTGIRVTFLQWCIFCAPVSLLCLIIAWKILISLYKTQDLTESQFRAFLDNIRISKGNDIKKDYYVGTILLLMITGWFASTWFPVIDTTAVAIFGLIPLMLPRIGVFDWKEFSKNASWEIFFLGGTAITLSGLAKDTGIVQLISELLQPSLFGISAPLFVVFLGVIVTAVLICIPIGPAVVSMLAPSVIAMANAIGLDPALAIITLSVFASNSSIVPLNSIFILSFATGYWKIGDLTKAGICISVVWIALAALWFPIIAQVI